MVPPPVNFTPAVDLDHGRPVKREEVLIVPRVIWLLRPSLDILRGNPFTVDDNGYVVNIFGS